MTMKNYIKYISLGTATLLLNSYCEASIKGDLINANVSFNKLDDNPANWKTVATDFINIFDTFNSNLIKIAEAHGGKAFEDSFIDPIMWQEGRVVEEDCEDFFLNEKTENRIKESVSSICKGYDKCEKYFKENIEKFLIIEICKTFNGTDLKKVADLKKKKKGKDLTAKDLKNLKEKDFKGDLHEAGVCWINNFVLPVGELLSTYAKEMSKDAESLQLLLDLHRCYIHCETIAHKLPSGWPDSFTKVDNATYSALANTIVACEESSTDKINILCDLLSEDLTKIVSGIENIGVIFTGCDKYGLHIERLVKFINHTRKSPVSTTIQNSLNEANEIANRITANKEARKQGFSMGLSARVGAGF